jgi:hypothetical protein
MLKESKTEHIAHRNKLEAFWKLQISSHVPRVEVSISRRTDVINLTCPQHRMLKHFFITNLKVIMNVHQ